MITSPFDPVKVLFFNAAISDPPRGRVASATKVALYVAIVLGGSALIGKPFLGIFGINLDVFRAVGGLIIAAMGFEMLYAGDASKAQGKKERNRDPEENDSLLIPLTLPLIAGPGAIATTISLTSQGSNNEGVFAALIAVAVVALTSFVAFAWLGELMGKIKPATVALLSRIGGLLLAVIGSQMLLSGLKSFFSG